MVLRCQSTIMLIAPNDIQRSHKLQPELIFQENMPSHVFNCGCLNKTVGLHLELLVWMCC